MENVKEFVQKMEMDTRVAALMTGAACAVGALVLLVRKGISHKKTNDKIQIARDRRTESLQQAELAVLRYKESRPSIDSARILNLSLSELTKQLKSGSLTPEDVFYSYMEKTLDVHKNLNCCTGVLLESFDQLKTIASNKDGLLYGVPVSIKENIAYKNHDSSCGVVINLDQPAKEDSVLVQVLKRQGAIPFVKTNLPQGLLNYDCGNPIYGQTVNPHNFQKTSGGSSGGEGALVGGGGSVLGLGSDIGGSIRIPAAFCGISGFKPTAGRISSQGVKPIYRGQKSVLSSAGPMAKDVESLALCMQALLCDHMFSLDPTIPPIPFNVQVYESTKPLRIGYLENDGYLQPSPSMVRAIREVKALLEQAGHTLVPYSPLKISYLVTELLIKGVFADGAATLLKKLKGSPLDPCLKAQVLPYYLPKWLKKALSFLLKPLVSSLPMCRHDYIQEMIAEWRRCNIDVLLCPVIGPAFNHLYCGRCDTVTNQYLFSALPAALTCTMIYNLLTFPAGVVPVTTVTAEDEQELQHYTGIYQDRWDRLFKQAVSQSEGLPVAVQCVALPWQDELCLRFMKEVEQLVKKLILSF
uniref:Fatty-acid amide hydrolase 1 n=1 Tax=Mastacembelus armatus TaxID=205130 RepID=A0A7N8XZL8_9TELE